MVCCRRSTKPLVHVGPGVARLNARVANPQRRAVGSKLGRELTTTIRQDALECPAGAAHGRQQHLAQEAGDGARGQRRQDAGHAIGVGRVARGDLPDFADAREAGDVPRQLSTLPGDQSSVGGDETTIGGDPRRAATTGPRDPLARRPWAAATFLPPS